MADEKQNKEVAPETEENIETQDQAAVEEEQTVADAEKAEETTDVPEKEEEPTLEEVKEELAADENAIMAMLTSVTEELEEMRKIRRRQGRYAAVGVLAILAILLAFMFNMLSFAHNYPVEALVAEIGANSSIVTESPEVQKVVLSAQKVFIPTYRRELVKILQAEAPQIEKTATVAVKDFRQFLMTDIRRKMVKRVEKNLKLIEKDIVEHYSKSELSPEELDKVFDTVNKKFTIEFSKLLEKRLDTAIKKLVEVNEEFNAFKKTPEYKKLKPEDIGLIENRLVETMLRIWIYQLNPEQGKAKVNLSEGGVK